MTEETKVLAPDPKRITEALRDTGYKFKTAVADLIDNSVAANANKVDVLVRFDLSGKVTLSIADNGEGMDRDGLIDAMRYGSPERSDPGSLGKFGLGLKTASSAFCRRFSLISRPSEEADTWMVTWDLDNVKEKNEWVYMISDEPNEEGLNHLNDIAAGSSGAVVLWEKVDRLLKTYDKPTGRPAHNALSKRCDELRQHIAMTYQRFLDNSDERARNIQITLNGKEVLPWDPFQKKLSELVAEEIESEVNYSSLHPASAR